MEQHTSTSGAGPRPVESISLDNLGDSVKTALDAALEKKAIEPVLLDVRGLATYTDYILVLSGRSDRHVHSIGDGVVEALARQGLRPIGVEGQQSGQWTLLDFGDLVVHVFHHPLREFYDLEGLWCDARRVELRIPAELRAELMY